MSVFFFNDTATTEIYTLSLHDALPIFRRLGRPTTFTRTLLGPIARFAAVALGVGLLSLHRAPAALVNTRIGVRMRDRKSTRLNSSHANISYAVFCLKKNKHKQCICTTS